MIRPKQSEVKSVPDNEVMLTFWGDVDVQTEHNTTRQMQKISKRYFTRLPRWLFSVLIIHLIRLARELPPEDPSNRASDIILLHPHAVPVRPAGGET